MTTVGGIVGHGARGGVGGGAAAQLRKKHDITGVGRGIGVWGTAPHLTTRTATTRGGLGNSKQKHGHHPPRATARARANANAWGRRRQGRLYDASSSGREDAVACRVGIGGFGGFGKKFEDSDDDYDDVIDVSTNDGNDGGNNNDSSNALSEKLNIELKSRGVDPDLPKLAAPGLLNELRDKRQLARFGSSFQIALALLASVIIWNVPKLVAAAAASLADACPALAPIVDAVAILRTLGVGFNPGVCAACTTATFKIIALCFCIGRLMSSGRLPRETPVVLSKLAFNVLLPTYMCTRVAATLNSTPFTLSLAALPVSAVLFVLLGGAAGWALTAAAATVPGLYRSVWHPVRSPAGSAADIAEAAAGAVGIPGGGYVMNPGGVGSGGAVAAAKKAAAKEAEAAAAAKRASATNDPMARIGIACCAFGNTFTLPLVFLVEVLGALHGDRVAGYIALYLVGWSPALWTVGYILLTGGAGGGGGGGGGGSSSSSSSTAAAAAKAGREGASSFREKLASVAETCKYIVKETVNPPLVGICLGILIGVTPLRHVVLGGGIGAASAASAAASSSPLPPELGLVAAALKALFELAVLIGGAALPGQTLVLASSFIVVKSPEEKEAEEREALSKAAAAAVAVSKGAAKAGHGGAGATWFGIKKARGGPSAGAASSFRKLASTLTAFLALDEADARSLVIASLVRFLLLPAFGVVSAVALRAAGSPWYPTDPIVALVVLTMAAMPPAQNLVLLTNLKAGDTRC